MLASSISHTKRETWVAPESASSLALLHSTPTVLAKTETIPCLSLTKGSGAEFKVQSSG